MPPKTKKSNTRKDTTKATSSLSAKKDKKKALTTTSEKRHPVETKDLTLKKNQIDAKASDDADSEEGSLDVGACCLCHSSMDFTDRAAFFRPDRYEDFNEDTDNEDDYYFRPNDPYLPVELYDANNALLYCDGCNRLYHQKCHFCPVAAIPRGEWHCLLCTYFSKKTPSPAKNNNNKRNEKSTIVPKTSTKLFQSMKEAFTNQTLFVSPPVPSVRHLEQAWEFESRHVKALHFQSQVIKRLRTYVESQASNYRLAETAVLTLTSTAKNRSHFLKQSTSSSQELAQTLVKLYGIRKNWRQTCRMLHDLQRSTHAQWDALQRYCDENAATLEDFIKRVLFPFGRKYGRREEPRTAEARLSWNEAQEPKETPPKEILVGKTASTKGGKKKAPPPAKRDGKKAAEKDDESGISLDDLQCCVCRTSEATDENDLVLCDGQGCFRAYHAHCVSPTLKEADLEENVDWFCPFCSALADTLLSIQTIHMGDEWEQERYAAMLDNKRHSDLDSSLQSWSHVDQVFPTAESDYAAACQMKEGKRNKATDDLLARVLGIDALPDHDSDDEVEDGNFDLELYQKEREDMRKKRQGESDEESEAASEEEDDSAHSSQATLVEMSSVELEVGKAELDALSKCSSDEEEESDEQAASRRRSRRLRKGAEDTKGKELVDDIGEFDESNIVEGKRGRKPVDYIQLNQAIFGDVPDEDAAVLDDAEEFKSTAKQKAVASDDESSDNNSNSDDEHSDEEQDDDDDQQEGEDDGVDDEPQESIENAVGTTKAETKKPTKNTKGQKRMTGKNGVKNVAKKQRLSENKPATQDESADLTKCKSGSNGTKKRSSNGKTARKNGITNPQVNGKRKKEPEAKTKKATHKNNSKTRGINVAS